MTGKYRFTLVPLIALLALIPYVTVATASDTLAATLEFASYWGIGGANNRSVAVDPAGNVYMSGGSGGPDWPTTDGSTHQGGSDVAIAKFAPDGRMLWSILLGGPFEDYAYVSAVSDSGELYVAGRAGEGFPTTEGAFDRTFNGGIGGGPHSPTDAFVLKLSTDGKLLYSTYIGGSADENGRAIHLLPSGKLIIGGGNTSSTDLPTDRGTLPGPVLKPNLGGATDSWVAVVAADGRSLDFLTYFGPDDDSQRGEVIRALGTDSQGNIWIGGQTSGTDMTPTADAFQKKRGTDTDAYLAKLSMDGKQLLYFSWLGGNGPEEIENEGISDAEGNFYIAGSTGSTDFPVTAGAFQSELRGGTDAGFIQRIQGKITGTPIKRTYADGWVAKVNNDGTLGFATLYGGSTPGPEALFGPAVGADGTVCATGRFRSHDLPVTTYALQPHNAGPQNTQDSVLVCFSPDGKELRYASYYGGTDIDHGRHIAAGPDGHTFHIVGETKSRDLTLENPSSSEPANAFIAKFRLSTPPPR